MNKCLQRLFASLLLLSVFAPMRTAYGQPGEYATLIDSGRYEYWAGRYVEAEALLLRALAAAQRDKNEYAIAAAHGDLGAVYQGQERLIEAQRSYDKALSIFRGLEGKTYELAVVLRNLGSVYSLNGHDSDARKVLQEALKLIKKGTPDEQSLAAQILNGLAMVDFRQGKISSAEKMLAQARGTRSAAAGRDPDLVDAQILSNLGTVYQKQRKHARAEESYKRSLTMAVGLLGHAHPYLTVSLANLGDLYIQMRRYSEARHQYRQSLGILEQMNPLPDIRIVGTLQALGRIYLREGDESSAESMLARAVEISRRNPVQDPEMPTLLEAYANVLKSLGKLQQAQSLDAEARRTRAAMALTVRVPKPN